MSRDKVNSAFVKIVQFQTPRDLLGTVFGIAVWLCAALSAQAECPNEGCMIAAGQPGSEQFLIASEIASRTSEQLEMKVLAVASEGGFEDVVNVNENERLYTFAWSSELFDALMGEQPFKEKQENIRAMGSFYTRYYLFLTARDSDSPNQIQTLAIPTWLVDWLAKGDDEEFLADLNVLGFPKGVEVMPLEQDERALAVALGRVDGGVFVLEPNSNAVDRFLEVTATDALKFIALSPENLDEAFVKKNPGFFVSRVSGDLFPQITGESSTISESLVMVTNQEDDDDCDEEKTEVIYSEEFSQSIIEILPHWVGFQEGQFDLFQRIGLPLHPGAQQYWKKSGRLE